MAIAPTEGRHLALKNGVHVELHETLKDGLLPLKDKGYQVVVTSLSPSSVPYTSVDFTRPTAVVMGAECSGVSQLAKQLADYEVTIPMVGMVESLNVSVASAILLQEAYRQRAESGLYNECRLPPETYKKRFFKWAHPAVAEFCDERGLAYPEVNDDDGEIVDPSGWYRQVREGC